MPDDQLYENLRVFFPDARSFEGWGQIPKISPAQNLEIDRWMPFEATSARKFDKRTGIHMFQYPYATGRSVVVDATSIYNAASPASAAMGGVSGTGQNHECTITKGDGTTTTLVVDCSGIYTAARQGYTQGTFTLTSVTPQGDSQSVYIVPSSGGTAYAETVAGIRPRSCLLGGREMLPG